MRADLIIDELQCGCTDFIKAAAPDTWGQAMEVPDLMPKIDVPLGRPGSSVTGGTAAKMSTPGAIISG